VYNLLLKYVYELDVPALFPVIGVPDTLTRAGVPDVRARTARFDDCVWRFCTLLRDTTSRLVPLVERVGVIEREETLRVPTPRDVTFLVRD
jgi:hypothetical protein